MMGFEDGFMIKWIFIIALIALQITVNQSFAKEFVSSAEFNELIENTNLEQMETAHVLWNHERVKDYIRRKRTLQSTKTMIADSAASASDEKILSQKLFEN
jgi:hypothetical protein